MYVIVQSSNTDAFSRHGSFGIFPQVDAANHLFVGAVSAIKYLVLGSREWLYPQPHRGVR